MHKCERAAALKDYRPMAEPQQDTREKPAGGGAAEQEVEMGYHCPLPNWHGAKCQELVLKVRIQSPKEKDFIEVELNRHELSYQNLLRVSCCELGINPEQVEKIRKLPNTLLRKDRDILRLQDFQEVELFLKKNGSSELIDYTPPLTEKPCYNCNAAKMTY